MNYEEYNVNVKRLFCTYSALTNRVVLGESLKMIKRLELQCTFILSLC